MIVRHHISLDTSSVRALKSFRPLIFTSVELQLKGTKTLSLMDCNELQECPCINEHSNQPLLNYLSSCVREEV